MPRWYQLISCKILEFLFASQCFSCFCFSTSRRLSVVALSCVFHQGILQRFQPLPCSLTLTKFQDGTKQLELIRVVYTSLCKNWSIWYILYKYYCILFIYIYTIYVYIIYVYTIYVYIYIYICIYNIYIYWLIYLFTYLFIYFIFVYTYIYIYIYIYI